MAILLLGANGFIGERVAAALQAAGFAVERGASSRYDLAMLHDAAQWRDAVRGREAVVNAAGLFRETPTRSFDAIHARGPSALFEACAAEGVPVVQVSALGAALDAPTEFLRSKARADERLLSLDLPSLVLQPSLVFGMEGTSARLFLAMAAAPVLALPGRGEQAIQPVHADDVSASIVRAVRDRTFPRARVAAVGPRALTLRQYLQALREAMGLRRGLAVTIPMAIVKLAARTRVGLLDRDAVRMLEAGNIADASGFERLLGRAPRDVADFIRPGEQNLARTAAATALWTPVLRIAIAFMWIAAAVVSAGIFPREASDALLAEVGLTGTLATMALYGASALDLALGVATLLVRRRALWTLQALLVLGYTAIITVFLPEQWLHPFGPVVKNVPILAAILLMHALEPR